MVDLIGFYDRLIAALRADDDVHTATFFAPDFIVHEDPGMPYGGSFHGAAAFIALRHKVRTFWRLAIVSRCAAPEGDRLVIVLEMTGLEGRPTMGMKTMVTVVWTVRDGKATEATVLYFNTPPIAAAINAAADIT